MLDLLLEQTQQETHQAQLRLLFALQQQENYQTQVEKIEQYRLEYFRQMSQQGEQGLSASRYQHLNRFIVQLDETLAKQKNTLLEFEQEVDRCRAAWQACKQKERALAWLIEKRDKKDKEIADKLEQKQQDEFGALAYFYRKHRH